MNASDSAQACMHESMIFWRNIADLAPDAILGIGFDGRIYYANQSATEIYGYSQEELQGMRVVDLRAPEVRAEWPAILEKAKQAGISFCTKNIRKNGEVFPVEVNVRVVDLAGAQVFVSLVRDNSMNEKLAEEARLARTFADNLVRAANVIVVLLDQQGKIRLFNAVAEKITGYSAAEAIGQDAFSLLAAPELRSALRNHFFASLTPRHVGTHDNPILTKSGEIRVISWQVCTIDGQQGGLNMLSFGLDITDRLQERMHLRRQESFIHSVVEGMKFAFCVLDRNYCYLAFNESHRVLMQRAMGTDIKVGMNYLSLSCRPELHVLARQKIDRALAGETCIVEAAKYADNIGCVLLEYSPVAHLDGDIIGVAVVTHDIGSLRNAEAELQFSNQRYRELVENAPVIILVVSSGGEVQYINPFGAKTFGYEPNELIGKSIEGTIVSEYESTGRNLWTTLQQFKNGTEREFSVSGENITRRGRRLWLDWTVRNGCSPLTGNQGWLCMGIDMTVKHRAMERLLKYRRQNDVMNDIISGRITEERAVDFFQSMGLDVRRKFQCIVIAPEQETFWAEPTDHAEGYREEQGQLAEHYRLLTNGVVWENMGCIGILMPCHDSTGETKLNERANAVTLLWQKIRMHDPANKRCRIGVAFKLFDDIGIRQLYYQAYSASQLGWSLRPGKELYFWHELGWVRLLVQNLRTAETKRYVQEHLGGVIDLPDPVRREILLETMSRILHGTSVEEVASQLCIHKQTIRYRQSVIEKLLGQDSLKGENAVNLSIALRLYEMQQKVHGEFPVNL